MRILQIYNRYRSGGGGETLVVNNTVELLRRNGHDARLLEQDSAEIISGREKILSALGGIYSITARRRVSEELRVWKPDIVHVHNLYPLYSPSILSACRSLGVPVVMTVHNYGLTCPIQTHVRRGIECTQCVDSGDQQCIANDCRDNLVESVVYAARHAAAKAFGLFNRNVTLFLPVSKFVQESLKGVNIPESRTLVVPNGVPIPDLHADAGSGKFALFLGRFTPEKGIATLLSAADSVPEVQIRFYGDGPLRESMQASAPANVSIHSWAGREQLAAVYREARCVVVPSIWNEPCPMVAIEAMSQGLPVVASRVGGLSSIVIDNETGFLVTAGVPAEIARCLRSLATEPTLAGRLGRRARDVAESFYSDSAYYGRLMTAYDHAKSIHAEQQGPLRRKSTRTD
jgi:glycosyltransferase involved in cell wall biosynthesis